MDFVLRMLNERMAAPLFIFFILPFILFYWVNPAHACGEKSDCSVASGDYRIFLPKNIPAGEKIPAIVYIHGLGGSSSETLRNRRFRNIAKELEVALVAVNGRANSWTFPNGVERGKTRNEFTYFSQVLKDIKSRFPIDQKKIVAAGFSIGASMTWYLACFEPQNYAGYITLSGTMWRPQPNKCVKPIGEIYHSHGALDRVFPLDGRVVRGKRQGAIMDTFDLMYEQDRCTAKIIRKTRSAGRICKYHQNCGGETLRLCLDNGAHDVDGFYLLDGFREIAKARGF